MNLTPQPTAPAKGSLNMNFTQLALILKARAKIICLIFTITLAATLAALAVMPKTYKASTALILNYKGADPLTGNVSPGQLASGYLSTYQATQIEIIKSPSVAMRVVQDLNLVQSPAFLEAYARAYKGLPDKAAFREWICQSIIKKLQVKPSKESSVINIAYENADAKLAAAIANGFADAYRKHNIALEVGPSRDAELYFQEQLKTARDLLGSALAKMTKFQVDNGVVNLDRQGDVESLRLNELSSQLVAAQAQLMEAVSRRDQLRTGLAQESPDVTNNALIQNLKIDLSKATVKLHALSEKFATDHPVSMAMQAEVASIQSELKAQVAVASHAIANNASILARREQTLSAAVANQKTRVLDLSKKHAELAVLAKEVETAQRIYDAVSQRLAQTRIQAQSNQSDVAVLTPAKVPTQASTPATTGALATAAIAGLTLGIVVAFASELRDRRILSSMDFEQLMGLPVLVSVKPFQLGTSRGREFSAHARQPTTPIPEC
ncbi:chain length determinant protein EpsF [Pseudoduganella namucuonensis]|uniref:Chain length determinant protein EpsF n=1 Tax=Pseudoduganella namucuonensis TaxID=1035707 RepID=A0A1I7M550_9BURK|nr:chain length determinant protein EpsF [Pseudoduganella namucuonensis]SFV17036.1 chain length determinant protein EpsF [Pseudoduganella namucuonensis]